ncbi:MAG: hypothetical protein ACPGEG_03570 [Salibacteraceae bacterium]
MNKSLKIILVVIIVAPLFIFNSCNKEDDSFTAIKVATVEDKLVGAWRVVNVRAVGDVDVNGIKIQAVGKNDGTPTGSYVLERTETEKKYTYDLEAKIVVEALNGIVKQEFNYDDHDAGTWEVSDNEKSVTFAGNQGLTQQLFFTQYDSNATLFMEVAIPVDTVISGYDYEGTLFIEMSKNQ